jgi:hypothetical protein
MVGFISKKQMALDRWTVTLEQDEHGFILPLPDELFSDVGWQVGDEVQWVDKGNGIWHIINMRLSKDGLTSQNPMV